MLFHPFSRLVLYSLGPIAGRFRGGEPCPVCALYECGDVNCCCYRPKRPLVRQAMEDTVLRYAMRLGVLKGAYNIL